MYYSYYKIIAEANNISSGIEKLLSDNISEYPNIIDATMKYSLLPEVRFSCHFNKKLSFRKISSFLQNLFLFLNKK